MATQLGPLDDEPAGKRHKSGGSGGFGTFDEEFESLLNGPLSGGLSDFNAQKHRPQPSHLNRDDEDDGIRVEDLAVANEQGEAIGAYVAPKHLRIEDAYQRYITSKQRPITDFDQEITGILVPLMKTIGLEVGGDPKSVGSSDEDSESEDLVSGALSRMRVRKTEQLTGKKRSRASAQNPHEIMRQEINRLCEFGGLADSEYILNRFQEEMRMAGLTEDHLFTRMCPLCGFMDNTQDAVGNQEFQMIDRFADEGIGNMDPGTHATLLAFLWNNMIYLPMRRRNMRILPLTSRMAYDHVMEPHRLNKRVELYKDILQLRKTHTLLFQTSFKANGMTGELSYDKDRLLCGLKVLESKWKLLDSRSEKDPFRTAHRVTAASVGTQTNPLQSVRRRPHQRH